MVTGSRPVRWAVRGGTASRCGDPAFRSERSFVIYRASRAVGPEAGVAESARGIDRDRPRGEAHGELNSMRVNIVREAEQTWDGRCQNRKHPQVRQPAAKRMRLPATIIAVLLLAAALDASE